MLARKRLVLQADLVHLIIITPTLNPIAIYKYHNESPWEYTYKDVLPDRTPSKEYYLKVSCLADGLLVEDSINCGSEKPGSIPVQISLLGFLFNT